MDNKTKDEILDMYYELRKEYDNIRRREYDYIMEHEYEKSDIIDKYNKLQYRINYLKKQEKKHLENLMR